MSNIPRNQLKLYLILCIVIVSVIMLLIALMNFSLFFLLLIALVVGICLLRLRKPEIFDLLSKEKKGENPLENDAPSIGGSRNLFTAHIILLYNNGTTMRQIAVDQQEFTIGRAPTCNLILDGNSDISRLHAVICFDEATERSTILDKSTHGTKVNGESLTPGKPHVLHSGDLIQIEDRTLEVQQKYY